MKIKKLKIKLNKDNEYSDYRYFIPKSNNIKMTDGRDVDEAVQSLKDKIANLKEQANYLIDKAPLVKYAEGTSITITDCAETPLRKFSIEGDSYQETREGYNKFNGDNLIGITPTSIGTSYIINEFDIDESGIYTIVSNLEFYYNFKDSNDNTIMNGNTSSGIAKITITDDNINTIQKMMIFINEGSLNKVWTKLMLLKGEYTLDNSPEYEQYGASPSIEYEAPIESVGDNINLLDGQFRQGSYNLINNKIRLFTTQNYKVEAGKTYTLATNLDFKTYKYSIGLAVSEFPEVAQSDLYYDSGWLEKTETTFTSEKDGYFGIGITRQNASEVVPEDMKDFYFKLVEGTSTGAYSPYGQGSIEIKNVNKNILKLYDIAETTKNGLTYSCINGKIKINGTATALKNIWFNDLDIKMNVGEYTLSSNTNLQGKGSVALKDLNGNIVQTNLNTPAKITLNENRTATQFLLQISSGATFTNFEMEIQLELGSIATEYVEHQSQTKALYTQQPFRAIEDVKDRFVKQDGVWYEEHKIFRKIFDGTENWLLGAPNYRYYIEINNKAEMSNIDITPLSSRFVCVSGTGIEIDYDTIWLQKLSDSSFRINIFNTNYLSDLANFKKWLTELYNTGTPVYVDYVLETPTLIPCTAEQVEVLESLQSYDKITYYSVDKTNNVQANIKLIYKQDINAILEGGGSIKNENYKRKI